MTLTPYLFVPIISSLTPAPSAVTQTPRMLMEIVLCTVLLSTTNLTASSCCWKGEPQLAQVGILLLKTTLWHCLHLHGNPLHFFHMHGAMRTCLDFADTWGLILACLCLPPWNLGFVQSAPDPSLPPLWSGNCTTDLVYLREKIFLKVPNQINISFLKNNYCHSHLFLVNICFLRCQVLNEYQFIYPHNNYIDQRDSIGSKVPALHTVM